MVCIACRHAVDSVLFSACDWLELSGLAVVARSEFCRLTRLCSLVGFDLLLVLICWLSVVSLNSSSAISASLTTSTLSVREISLVAKQVAIGDSTMCVSMPYAWFGRDLLVLLLFSNYSRFSRLAIILKIIPAYLLQAYPQWMFRQYKHRNELKKSQWNNIHVTGTFTLWLILVSPPELDCLNALGVNDQCAYTHAQYAPK